MRVSRIAYAAAMVAVWGCGGGAAPSQASQEKSTQALSADVVEVAELVSAGKTQPASTKGYEKVGDVDLSADVGVDFTKANDATPRSQEAK